MNPAIIYIPAIIVGFFVYYKRLPVVLMNHSDMTYALCKAWAGLQGLVSGIAVWGILELLVPI